MLLAVSLICVLIVTIFGQTNPGQWKHLQCQGSPVSNRYFNRAEGFSVAIPKKLRGRRGQAAGPERGVAIPISHDCSGVVVVYGEPNSFEWPTPADAIKWQIDSAVKDDPHAEVQRYKIRLGKVRAAGVIVRHRATSEVEEIVVAFRPGGGPIYTAMLATTGTAHKQDHGVFRKVLQGFRLEAWR